MTLEEFKNTKFHTIFLLTIKSAIYPKGFKKDDGYIVETEKYKFKFVVYSGQRLHVYATIKRPDCDTTKDLEIMSDWRVIYEYLKTIFYSEDYEFGKWIKSSERDWVNIAGVL